MEINDRFNLGLGLQIYGIYTEAHGYEMSRIGIFSYN